MRWTGARGTASRRRGRSDGDAWRAGRERRRCARGACVVCLPDVSQACMRGGAACEMVCAGAVVSVEKRDVHPPGAVERCTRRRRRCGMMTRYVW